MSINHTQPTESEKLPGQSQCFQSTGSTSMFLLDLIKIALASLLPPTLSGEGLIVTSIKSRLPFVAVHGVMWLKGQWK